MNINWDKVGRWLATADWFYQFADDPRAYREGGATVRDALAAWNIAHTIDPESAVACLTKHFPRYANYHLTGDEMGGYRINKWADRSSEYVDQLDARFRAEILAQISM